MDETDLLSDLDRTLAAVAGVVTGIHAGQWLAATPCTELDVRDVLNHLVRGNVLFAALVHDVPPPDRDLDHLGDDPLAAYQRAADGLREAFAGPGVLGSVYTAPFGKGTGAELVHVRIAENLAHGWDLARATGQPADFPEAAAERALRRSRQRLSPALRGAGAPFGEEVSVPDDAPAIDRLAGFLGRPVA